MTLQKQIQENKDIMSHINKELNKSNMQVNFKTGDTIEVYVRVKEGEKERIQVFKGLVLKTQGAGAGRSFTVRKITNGVGVERTFPYASPSIEKVRVIAYGQVRRSRLYYIRKLRGKAARIEFELAHSGSHKDSKSNKESSHPSEKTPLKSEKITDSSTKS